MAILDIFVEIIRRSGSRRRRNRVLNETDDLNDSNRNVAEYGSAPIEAFMPTSSESNILVSGSNGDLRDRVCCAAAWKCAQDGRGALILHCGNGTLTDRMQDVFRGESNFLCIDRDNPVYDPFIDLEKTEIAQLMISSSAQTERIESIGSSYIYGMYDYLGHIGRPICAETLYNCMRNRSHEQIEQDCADGYIPEYLAMRIQSELAQGQMEKGSVEQYLNIPHMQGQGLLCTERNFDYATSIRKALRERKIVMIDVSTISNHLLLDVIAQEIAAAMLDRSDFSVIVNSLSANATPNFYRQMEALSGRRRLVYVSTDAYADLESGNGQVAFMSILGRSDLVVALRHYSSISAQRFSDFFGRYERREWTRQMSQGRNGDFGDIFRGGHSNSSDNESLRMCNRLEESEISAQDQDHAFIKRSDINEIISVEIVSGDARRNYSLPVPQSRWRRRNRSNNARNTNANPSGGINWGVFILLLLFLTPFAFLYLFVRGGRMAKTFAVIAFILMLLGVSYVISINAIQ
ncbi:MAG: hypothetical protein J6B05_00020 [Clostridia bacterium]|nr:hypothetical protein [Clostridia bacterium]